MHEWQKVEQGGARLSVSREVTSRVWWEVCGGPWSGGTDDHCELWRLFYPSLYGLKSVGENNLCIKEKVAEQEQIPREFHH